MLGRLVLMLTIWPEEAQTSGVIRVTDADTGNPVAVQRGSFVLTLEREPEAAFARGHLRSTVDGADYPIQTTPRLFEALKAYLDHDKSKEV